MNSTNLKVQNQLNLNLYMNSMNNQKILLHIIYANFMIFIVKKQSIQIKINNLVS